MLRYMQKRQSFDMTLLMQNGGIYQLHVTNNMLTAILGGFPDRIHLVYRYKLEYIKSEGRDNVATVIC